MGIRFLVQLSFVTAALALAPIALADIPSPTGGSAGSSTTTGTGGAAGTGGTASAFDPNCNKAQEAIAGTTCTECNTGNGTGNSADPACSTLDSSYSMVCQSSAAVAVYCNGPVRDQPSDQNVSCSVPLPGAPARGLAAAGALVAAAAFMMRRRRR